MLQSFRRGQGASALEIKLIRAALRPGTPEKYPTDSASPQASRSGQPKTPRQVRPMMKTSFPLHAAQETQMHIPHPQMATVQDGNDAAQSASPSPQQLLHYSTAADAASGRAK